MFGPSAPFALSVGSLEVFRSDGQGAKLLLHKLVNGFNTLVERFLRFGCDVQVESRIFLCGHGLVRVPQTAGRYGSLGILIDLHIQASTTEAFTAKPMQWEIVLLGSESGPWLAYIGCASR